MSGISLPIEAQRLLRSVGPRCPQCRRPLAEGETLYAVELTSLELDEHGDVSADSLHVVVTGCATCAGVGQ